MASPVTLTAPGLYLRGTELAPAPVGSAVTGFVGVPERGPINVPQPLRGWRDYVDSFGGFVSYGYLAESVFGFFRNGGEKCWVVRAADTSRLSAPSPLPCWCPPAGARRIHRTRVRPSAASWRQTAGC